MFHDVLVEIPILLSLSVFSVAISKRIDIPTVVGYLLVGMVASQVAFGWISNSHALGQIAEIGVVFLLFTLGLGVSIPRLIGRRRIVFGIGPRRNGVTSENPPGSTRLKSCEVLIVERNPVEIPAAEIDIMSGR